MGRHAAPAPFDVLTTGPIPTMGASTGSITPVGPTTDPRLFDAPLAGGQRDRASSPKRPVTPPPPVAAPRAMPLSDARAAFSGPVPVASNPILRRRAALAPSTAIAPLPATGLGHAPVAPRLPAQSQQTMVIPTFVAASLHTGPLQLPAFDLDADARGETPTAFGRGRAVKLAACAVAVLGAVSGAALLLPSQNSAASAAEAHGCHPTGHMPRPTARPVTKLTPEQRRAWRKTHHLLPVSGTTTTTTATPTPSASASASASPTPTTDPTASTGTGDPGTGAGTGAGTGVLPPAVSTVISNLVSAASSVVDFATGTYSFDNFDKNLLGINLRGKSVVGQGVDKTVIRMDPNTSTKAASVPTSSGTTNQLYLMQAVGTKVLRDFTLIGTEQGHLYNGIRLGQTSDFRGSNIKVEAVPGNDHLPPGETFGINDWRTTGSVWSNIEVDGGGVGAAGFGANSSSDITVKNSYFHGNPYSLGATFWQTNNVTIVDTTSSGNRGGFNFERVSGTVNIIRPVLKGNSSSDISVGSDRESAKITITDPVLSPGQKLRIRVFNGYGAGANKQLKSDIHVIVDGVDRTADLVKWL